MIIDFITTPIWKALGEETDRAIDAETALKRNSFADAEYVPSEKMIYLSNGFGEVIDSIDCTDFVIDGMVESVTLNGNILTITFNTDAGKQNIDIDLTEFINPQNYYTKTETDNIVNSAYTSAVTYVDSEILSARTDASAYTDAALASAKAYTDSEVLSARTDAKTYTDNAIDGAYASAVTYVNSEISSARTDASAYTDNALVSAKTYTDSAIDSVYASAVTYIDSEVLSARTDASAYTDSALVSAKTYTDNAVNSVNEHILTFEKTTSIALNELKQEIEALKTRITALEG